MRSLEIEAVGRKLEIPLVRIASIQPQPEKGTVALALRNADKVTGKIQVDVINLSTILGEISFVMDKVKRITLPGALSKRPEVLDFRGERNRLQESLRMIERDRVVATSQQAQYATLVANLKRLSRVERRKALPTVFPDPVLTEVLGKLSTAEAELALQDSKARGNDSKLDKLTSLITNLNAQIDARVEGTLAGLAIQAEVQAARAALLERESNNLKKREADLLEQYRPELEAQQAREARERIAETIKLRMLGERVDAGVAAALLPQQNILEVTVSKQEPHFYLGLRPVTLEQLREEFLTHGKRNAPASLTIKLDADAPTAKLVKLLDEARAAGLNASLNIPIRTGAK